MKSIKTYLPEIMEKSKVDKTKNGALWFKVVTPDVQKLKYRVCERLGTTWVRQMDG